MMALTKDACFYTQKTNLYNSKYDNKSENTQNYDNITNREASEKKVKI
jgi:hypothetical protein